MKVTKAKGLNTIWLVDVATSHEEGWFDSSRHGPRMHRAQGIGTRLWFTVLPVQPRLFLASCSVKSY
jgi:hypothetical protein